MRVEVYYNLHKHLFSVRHKGKDISHRYDVQLGDVTFAVQEAGRGRGKFLVKNKKMYMLLYVVL